MTRFQRVIFWLRCQRWYPERDKVARWVAWRLPKRVTYWAFIRLATQGGNGPFRQVDDVLKAHGEEFAPHLR
jgi:hypothetical protein